MKQLIKQVPDHEDEKTIHLFKLCKSLKTQGYATKEQLLMILKWKSPRPLRQYELNDKDSIKEITSLAFATKNERLRIHILTTLDGVSYPAASAILMFYDRKRYPVLDIRVWQQLHKAKLVESNARGQNFTLRQWVIYLEIVRQLAKELSLSARQVEKRIFDFDTNTRVGKLYKS